jgi:hypothetical protein
VVLDALNAEFARTDSWPSTPGEGEEDGGFVEVDDGDDDGGFSGLAGESRDVLALEAGLEVTLAFERGEDGLFGFLNVVIEAVGEEEVNEVQQLRGENAVRLRYHVNVDGKRYLLRGNVA